MALSHDLPALEVFANRIVESATGSPVSLRGINRSGLEYSPSLEEAGIGSQEIETIVHDWGANIIRVPFNQDWALTRDDYLAALDSVIDMAAARGAYTLLDLQWLDHRTVRGVNQDGSNNFVPPLPDPLSPVLWGRLAARYRNEPAVLFDIFNEPHTALSDDPVPLLGLLDDGTTFPLESRRVTAAEWHPWARRLVRAIRDEHPAALIWVPGVNWAYDHRDAPIEGLENVVYTTHIYSNKGRSRHDYRRAFGYLADQVPVFAGEWGGSEKELDWGREVADYLEEIGAGWTAWSWADWPHLVERPLAPPYDPTPFGALVKNYLARWG